MLPRNRVTVAGNLDRSIGIYDAINNLGRVELQSREREQMRHLFGMQLQRRFLGRSVKRCGNGHYRIF